MSGLPDDDLVYLDHAASTPMRPEAIAAMAPFLADHPGNPSGGHRASRATKTALEEARETVAAVCGCRPHEVVFTGGGSEGDNLAVKGAAWAAHARATPRSTASSRPVSSTRRCSARADRLAREGFRVVRVPATAAGVVDLDALAAAVDDRTAVVSVMLVNNETGVRQPLDDVARARARTRAAGGAAHRCRAGAAVARSRGPATANVVADRDLGPQVRRPEGCRCARRPRRNASSSR